MKNIIYEKPSLELTGLSLANVRGMEDTDIKGKRILDIGCGYGWFEMHAVARGAEEVVGIEISEPDLATAKKHVLNDNVTFKVGSAIDLPFKDKYFDTVVSWEVLEHIPKGTELRMFCEVCRVLKPGGTFYLSTPETSFFSNILDPAWWLIGHRHYSKNKLCTYVSDSGFKISTIKSHGRYWTLLSILNMYIAKWIFRRHPFWEIFINKRVDEENLRDDGFADIFLKCNKLY